MPAYLENSAMATGLEKVRFHSNPEEGQVKDRNDMDLTEAEDSKKR